MYYQHSMTEMIKGNEEKKTKCLRRIIRRQDHTSNNELVTRTGIKQLNTEEEMEINWSYKTGTRQL